MSYGIPYQGSKSRIAKWVINHLPQADTLYDVFAGGCAITHAALLTKRFNRVVCNDITDAPSLFYDAMTGKYHDCDRWVSRDEFEMFKDTDPFVRILWSFGNDNKTYLYGRDVEPFKRELHKLVFAKTPTERRMQFRNVLKEIRKGDIENGNLESLQSLERIERLQELEYIADSGKLTVSQGDYRSVQIEGDCVVYCDPPYKGTKGYLSEFNHEEFYDWCRSLTHPVYISEYTMPDDFVVVDEVEVAVLQSAKGGGKVTEKLFTLKDKYQPVMKSLFD